LIQFDDAHIYEELSLSPDQREIPAREILRLEALVAFEEWRIKENKVNY
jgi:hypothetical protein